jgi:hypothetical protein
MPKQCAECGSVEDDQSPYCEACGARRWKRPSSDPKVLLFLLVALVAVCVGMLTWYFLRHSATR